MGCLHKLDLGMAIISIRGRRIPVRLNTELAIDYARTLAVNTPGTWSMGIYLNLVERFEHGIVKHQDVTQIRQQTISRLGECKDPTIGENAIYKVLDSKEAYWGKMWYLHLT
jgi:predicted AlkP superfamily phosphohydrolase/phosphomutase